MKVIKLEGPPFEKVQCQLPSGELREIGWKGYRERRAQINGNNPATCMRHARWEVDGILMCSQHAGIRALEHLKVDK